MRGMAKVASGQRKRALEPGDAPGAEPDGAIAPTSDGAGHEEEPAMVDLADLVSDQNGEVVLFNDSGLRALAVSTVAAVTARGRAGRHVTATGEDVSGFGYVSFDNGLKLFHQPDLELIVVPARR